MDAEQIVRDIAERVRAIVTDAEERAAEIIREAEADAKRIRERAEVDGLEQLRRAFDEVQGRLGAATGAGATPGRLEAEVEPGPVVVPEPEPPETPEPAPAPVPEPTPEPTPAPEPVRIPEPTPPPDEGTPPAAGGYPQAADPAGARLVAMNMALDGASREQIEAKLAEEYDLDDAKAIVDDVLALARK